MRTQKRLPAKENVRPIVVWSFWVLATICLLNLNGVMALAFGATRLLSFVILGTGLSILSFCPIPWRAALGRSGSYFITFLALYLLLGSAMRPHLNLAISHINSIFVVTSAAVATRWIVAKVGLVKYLNYLTIVATLGAFSVFLSPFLGSLYRNIKTAEMVSNVGRWLGFFANPNETGMAAVYALAVCLATWMLTGKKSRLHKYLPILVGALAVGCLLTFSRGALLAFLVVGVGFVITITNAGKLSSGVFVCGLFVALVGYWFFTDGYKAYDWTPEQHRRLLSMERILTSGQGNERDTGGRMSGIRGGLHYWQQSPILGHGLGSFHKLPDKYFGGLGCHNTHLMVLGEVGIVGALVYLTFWLVMLQESLSCNILPIRIFGLMLMTTLFLNGLVGHTLLDNRNSNLLTGVAFGLLSFSREYAIQAQRKKAATRGRSGGQQPLASHP